MRTALVAVLCGIGAPALAQPDRGQEPARAANPDPSVTVAMKDAKGRSVGTVEVRQLEHGTVFVANLRGLPPGPHGFHVHERGACDAPSFTSAGGHYNPGGKAHGFDSPRGPHAGDLPNVHVDSDGTARAELHSARLLLHRTGDAPTGSPLQDDDGSAIVIHARGDDYQVSTPDSTGDRIACGVIAKPQP